ncbi:MAG: FtsW/RodA/SpoVE family cell cycle protein [Selenomonadaceae bacterium]|nr:FtsW/RodA/SpoVE family cell cycle protein [Selenomonadaceae bacterium]
MSKTFVLLLIDFGILFLGLGELSLRQYPNYDLTPYMWGGIAAAGAFIVQIIILKGKLCKDKWLFPIVMFFSCIGIIMLGRLKPILCVPQIRWLLIGMAVMVLVLMLAKYFEEILQYQYILGVVTLFVLCLSLLFGTEIGGSKNWLILGPIQVQPSEFGKILLVLFLSSYLSDHRQMLTEVKKRFLFLDLPPLRFIAPLLCIWGIAILMFVIQRDLGSALLFFCMAVGMTYMATGSKSYVFIALCFFGVGALLSYALFSHVQVRFNIWLDPWADPTGQAYQVVQSLFAFGAGGVWGTGFAHGQPLLIPEVHTDFIFSAIGEEMGFLGCSAIMLGYMLFFYRGVKIALNCQKDLYMLSAAGFAVAFFLQAFIIIAGVTKFLPLTGITLPFISYGGSSMVSGFIMVGLLLALSNKEKVA